MKKYISLFVFLSLILTSGVVYAESNTGSEAEKIETDSKQESEIEKVKQERDLLREQEKNKLEIMKQEREKAKEADKSGLELLKQEREQQREKVKNEIESMKVKREQEREKVQTEISKNHEEFQKQIEIKRAELKEKSIANREQLKEKLKTIKDEKKQNIVLSISDNLEKINIKATDRLESLLEKIEIVLLNTKDRADKAKASGVNVDEVYTLISKAEVSISEARTSITTQIAKTYKVEVTDESKLKGTMQTIRDRFQADIKVVQDKVKLAHEAVRAVAKSLGSIMNQNNNDNSESEVDDKTKTPTTTKPSTIPSTAN